MGASGIGVILGGGLLGLGAAALMSKKTAFGSAMETHSNMAAGHPVTPEAPIQAEAEAGGSVTENAGMEEERERERQAALLRQQRAQEVFTSGLGAAGVADTAKKTLLGG